MLGMERHAEREATSERRPQPSQPEVVELVTYSPHPGMDQSLAGEAFLGGFRQLRVLGEGRGRSEEHEVLPVIERDGGIIPDPVADGVEASVPACGELLDPVVRPLLVDVMNAALVGDRRREGDEIAVSGDVVQKEKCLHWPRQVLGDLGGHDQVEGASEIERAREVVGYEELTVDAKPLPVDVIAVDSVDVIDAFPTESREERSGSAADIEDRGGLRERKHDADDRRRGLRRRVVLIFEEV